MKILQSALLCLLIIISSASSASLSGSSVPTFEGFKGFDSNSKVPPSSVLSSNPVDKQHDKQHDVSNKTHRRTDTVRRDNKPAVAAGSVNVISDLKHLEHITIEER